MRLLVGMLFGKQPHPPITHPQLLPISLGYTFLLFLNVIVAIAGVVAVVSKKNTAYNPNNAIVNVVMSIIFLFLFPVLALFCWFMPVYTAYRYCICF